MAPNMNLFDLMNEKKMDKALRKNLRVKRLQAEVMKSKGIKVALYSASLLLEENLSVAEAAKVIGEHHDRTADVVAVVNKMVQALVPSMVEGVLAELEKKK
nr:PREDICTED: uncharacterized protein LOC109039972 [Bemisia tabaci]